jgi:hypothetical protein
MPSRDQSRQRPAGTPGASPALLRKGRRTGQMAEETMLLRRQANKSQPVTLRHFSHWPRRIGSAGEGVSGARCGLRHDRVGRCRKLKSEGEKREGGRELLEKRWGTSASLYLAKCRAGR